MIPEFSLRIISRLKILIFSLLLFAARELRAQADTDSLLRALDHAIEKKEFYVQEKLHRIQALKDQLQNLHDASLPDQFNICNKLYHEYKIFVYDSAFKYGEKLSQLAYELNDPARINYARVKMTFIFLSSGMFKETFESIKNIQVRYLPDSSKINFYMTVARAYFDVGNYDNDAHFTRNYIKLGIQYLDSASRLCEKDSYNYLYIKNYRDTSKKALEEEIEMLKRPTLTVHQRAVNSYRVGNIYLVNGDSDRALAWFITSAIADIESVTKENAALNSVADILYKKGDIKNAYRLIEVAMEDALYYGAKQRKIEIGSILPIIATEKVNNVESQRRLWLIYSAITTALGILVLGLVFVVIKQVKQLKEQVRKLKEAELLITRANHNLEEINHQLREADKIKEEYIGYYFNINSDYINKIEEFKQVIDQKLTAKKFDDIKFIVNNLNPKRQKEELFVSFDKVFLKLFPDFVASFNSFFGEEDQIVMKENQMLTTELRIFALIRMGIHDPEKIAKILGYTVNTIYTYKTKVKRKSLLPNEEFEKKIMEIKTV